MIIGITGKKQSGKSTVAEYLEKEHGYRRLNFKDALIREMRNNFPDLLIEIANTLDKTNYDGMNPWTLKRMFEEKPPLVRRLMQNYGTDVRRKDHPDYWTVQWLKLLGNDRNVVVDDVRFINEAQTVKDVGGVIVRIVRTDLETPDTHVSETEMDNIVPDYTISVKTGEQDVLYAEIDKIILQSDQVRI